MQLTTNMVIALFGAVVFCLLYWRAEKQKHDNDAQYARENPWRSWLTKSIDDILIAFVAALVLGYFQPVLVRLFFLWRDDLNTPQNIEFYELAHEFVSFLLGLFGSALLVLIYDAGKMAANIASTYLKRFNFFGKKS